jgi:hypothetical protein
MPGDASACARFNSRVTGGGRQEEAQDQVAGSRYLLLEHIDLRGGPFCASTAACMTECLAHASCCAQVLNLLRKSSWGFATVNVVLVPTSQELSGLALRSGLVLSPTQICELEYKANQTQLSPLLEPSVRWGTMSNRDVWVMSTMILWVVAACYAAYTLRLVLRDYRDIINFNEHDP